MYHFSEKQFYVTEDNNYVALCLLLELYAQPNQGYISTVPGRCYEVKAYYLEDVLKM